MQDDLRFHKLTLVFRKIINNPNPHKGTNACQKATLREILSNYKT